MKTKRKDIAAAAVPLSVALTMRAITGNLNAPLRPGLGPTHSGARLAGQLD